MRRASWLLVSLSLCAIDVAFVGCASDQGADPKAANPQPARNDGGTEDDGEGSIPDDQPVTEDKDAEEMHTRADLAAETMMLRYWSKIGAPTYHSGYWTYAHDWNVILDAVERRGPEAYAGTIRMFYDAQAARGWIVDFYDDEEWMTLTLIHAYQLTKDETYLKKAQELFNDIRGGWDETCCGAVKGGIWWDKKHTAKVTASNGGAILAGVLLYEITSDGGYLASARKFFDYWSKNMVDSATGHVYDNIDASNGKINKEWSFTYNEGLMIGATVALARVEKDPALLQFAQLIGSYMLAKETEMTPLGTVLSDGPCGSKGGNDGEQFKGIGARYLADLFKADPSKVEFKDVLVRSSNAIWTLARDPSTNLVSCYWPGPHQPDFTSVNALSSAAMTLAVTAQLMGKAVPRPPLEYQAEEATLHGVGLEASHVGFEGWGYLAGWGTDGQWIDFPLNVPTAGSYDIEFRYSSADDAARELYLNGATVQARFDFPKTGGYDNYLIVTKTVTLKAGQNGLSVIFRPSSGSKGYLNLDRIKLFPK
ncbi:MAG TPA: glycoside hydrolase family 76 protein [Labilithrix sp.]|jgi:predicted alpha-1,6-mannanase (GH76 family)|nr:glycoside hydrolase family 76 protein [Labilithrix sp.]